ncbi:amino acid permease [Vibrio alfacsensis]|uniref:amino acid permease n=1 Tax=Vibrio alfacsensis TaxID=1074311 RepID=UPI0040696998
MNESVNSRKHLSLFGFFALSATMVVTIYEYPTFASSGVSLVFYFVVAGLFCFLTVALCAAEMARLEGGKGGVYTWAGKSHGEKWGGVI